MDPCRMTAPPRRNFEPRAKGAGPFFEHFYRSPPLPPNLLARSDSSIFDRCVGLTVLPCFLIHRWRNFMPAYLVVAHKITDAAKFEEYRSKVAPMIAHFGGRYLTKGGSHKILEKGFQIATTDSSGRSSQWEPERVVLIEFPDMETLNAWYQSPEYQPLIKLRHDSALDMLMTL